MTVEAQRTALVSMPVPKPTLSQVIIEKIREGATLEETKEYYRFLREIEADEQERQAKRAYDQERSLLEVELAPIATDCANPQTKSKYASLGQVIRAIRPLYSKHGIFVEFDTTESPKGEAWLRILALVSHRDGYSFQRQIDMPADGKGAQGRDVMTRAHAAMSAVTYGRRGLLLMIFNLAIGGEDDDGNAASSRTNGNDRGSEMLTFDEMEDIWECAREMYATRPRDITEEEYTKGWVKRLVQAVGYAELTEVPRHKYAVVVAKIKKFRQEATSGTAQS